MSCGDGSTHVLDPGGAARVDPSTVRKIRNVGEGDAVYVIVDGETSGFGPPGPPGA